MEKNKLAADKSMRHYNIPIFIPELACPFRCVYCNQFDISGTGKIPDPNNVIGIIEQHLATIPVKNSRIEIAFFGGNFTGIDFEKQKEYLSIAKSYLESGKVRGIRLSTRPDYISTDILNNLKSFAVTAIEIGAQSMDDDVLNNAGRGHTSGDVLKAAALIREFDFELGIQMMTGLPGDSPGKAYDTAKKIIALNADTARIYPTLVLADSKLAELFRKGYYKPQSLEEAVDLCAAIFMLFENAGVKVLRVGLHPSEALYDRGSMLAGPFHPAFGEMVMTLVWKQNLEKKINNIKGKKLRIAVHPSQINSAIGHKAANRIFFKKAFKKVCFYADESLSKYQFHVDYC